MTKFYTVQWRIEVEAESHVEAAFKALETQKDPNSTATIFEVHTYSRYNDLISIDTSDYKLTKTGYKLIEP